MKRAALNAFLMLLLVAAMAVAADLGAYPSPFMAGSFFDAQIIIGNNGPATDALAATEIAVSLQQLASSLITASTEDEFNPEKNSILIGLPCQNNVTARILNANSCSLGIKEGQGYLKLLEKDGITHLIISGNSAADTRKAARLLAKYGQHSLSGKEMIVTGTLESPKAEALAQPLQPKPQVAAAECVTSDNCPADKWCLAGKCMELGCPEGTKAENHDCVPDKKKEEQKETKPAAKNDTPAAPEKPTELLQAANKRFFARMIEFLKSIFS